MTVPHLSGKAGPVHITGPRVIRRLPCTQDPCSVMEEESTRAYY